MGLELHKFSVDSDYFMDNYEDMVWHNDAPVYKPFFCCFKRLAKGAKEYVTVLLSGEGADEIAGGYNRFGAGVYQPFIAKMRNGGIGGIKSYSTYAEYAVMSDSTHTGFVTTEYEGEKLIQEQMDIFNGFSGSNFTKHLKFEMTQRLPEALLRQDKMTMAHSIENRVPLLDNGVVDFIMCLPEHMLVRFADVSPLNMQENPLEWIQGKYILKEVIAKKFGRNFAYRKKETMNNAMNERGMLKSNRFQEYYNDVILPGMKSRGIINAEKVEGWYKSIYTISNADFNKMWRAIGLETWCQLFLD